MSRRIICCDGIFFDMDGTLVDSTAGVVGAWNNLRTTYPHLDVQEILSSSHGVRTIENLRQHLGIEDPEILEKKAERFEKDTVCSASANGGPGIVLLPGVKPTIGLALSLKMPRVASVVDAGCTTIALLTSHSREQIEAAQPDFIIKDLSWISIERLVTGLQILIKLPGI